MQRNDILPFARAPKGIEQFLVRVAGRNPFGEPVFRLAIAEGILKQVGAEFYKWPDGTGHLERGKLVDDNGLIMEEPPVKPLSITAEMRWVPKYPQLKGWVLEEWHPADKFGTREEWESRTVPGYDHLPVLGPYVPEGRYMLAMPNGWGQAARGHENDPRFKGHHGLPPVSVLKAAIEWIEHNRNYWASLTPAQRRARWEDMDIQREELRKKYEREKVMGGAREVCDIILSSSLEAARVRNEWAKAAGIKSHVGS